MPACTYTLQKAEHLRRPLFVGVRVLGSNSQHRWFSTDSTIYMESAKLAGMGYADHWDLLLDYAKNESAWDERHGSHLEAMAVSK